MLFECQSVADLRSDAVQAELERARAGSSVARLCHGHKVVVCKFISQCMQLVDNNWEAALSGSRA